MAAITKLTIEISDDIITGLHRLAKDSAVTPAHLAGEALAAYVEQELADVQHIEDGLSDLTAGRVVSHDQAMNEITALINAAEIQRS